MSRIPRILPLAGVAVAGVLAINFMAGADSFPRLLSGAQAWAEGAPGKAAAPKTDTQAVAGAKPAAVCAPTAAELAKEAGLSPSELRMLQNLGERRGQLDTREEGMDVQLQLIAAAEAKLDAKFKALDTLKGDIKGLLGQADAQQEQEINRLVAVFSAMKAKDAAAQFRVLDDSVRLPIASKMKERTLAAILAQMPPAEAKQITEALAKRFTQNAAVLAGKQALAPEPPPAPTAGPQPKALAGASKAAPQAKAEAKPEAKPPAKAG
ncbi:MAG TPA: MotE family protein [Caulobacter sp.]|nr:MotE family protein [Caulobacter sp.]